LAPSAVDKTVVRGKRSRAYIASVADGERNVFEYIVHASSHSDAEREAREGAWRWGTTVIDVRLAVQNQSAGRAGASRRARALTAGAMTIGLVATTIAIATNVGGVF
jgi:hypothetical protein